MEVLGPEFEEQLNSGATLVPTGFGVNATIRPRLTSFWPSGHNVKAGIKRPRPDDLVRHRRRTSRLRLRHTLRRISCLHAVGRCSRLLRSIFRRALGLQSLGMEHAIVIEAPVGQRLGIV